MSEYQFTPYRIDEFSNKTLYRAMKLRSDVFVVEQNCVYPDLDDKDIHQSSIHLLCHSTGETNEKQCYRLR
jgi:ElaA protein